MIRNYLFIICLLLGTLPVLSNQTYGEDLRVQAQKLYQDGNYKDALAVFKKLVLEEPGSAPQIANDFNMAISCLGNLGLWAEKDAFRDESISIHAKNWRLLFAVSKSYRDDNHYGYLISGKFERGNHRGGGKYVNSVERDRVQALKLLEQCRHLIDDTGKNVTTYEKYNFYIYFSDTLTMYRGQTTFWRLQILTNLNELPDYEDGYGYYYNQVGGAPTDAKGNPVFYFFPESFDNADNDGERYRWLLEQAREVNPVQGGEIDYKFASFLHQHFGVQTMASYASWFASDSENETKERRDKRFLLHELNNNETIAKLAGGIKRFELPDEFNFIRLFKDADEKGYHSANRELARIFENRRQYDKSLVYWKRVDSKYARDHIKQITDPWGAFDPIKDQPAGKNATIDFRFRNGNKVHLEAYKINIEELLNDAEDYVRQNPRRPNWQKVNLNQIGYRLITEDQDQYITKKIADWDLALRPRNNHFDKRITVKTPLSNAGAYLLVSRMKNGNQSRIIIWLKNTMIARKSLDNKSLYWVTDSITGKPLADIKVDFFGYRQKYLDNKLLRKLGRNYNIVTQTFTRKTDALGRVYISNEDQSNSYNWLVTVNKPGDRLAYLGFSGVWFRNYYDNAFNQTKVFTITDRPVYRPGHTIKFKTWIRALRYDLEDQSVHGNQNMTFAILNPMGEEVLRKTVQTDEFGGFDGEFELAEDAKLGVYSCTVPRFGQGSTFRVEEYKKPEFEVKIDSPEKPVALGETIDVNVSARYYFGTPVKNANAKVKVLRYSHSSQWYPLGAWDWFYGRGYWWFHPEYTWYPNWHKWGCRVPYPWWYGQRSTPPEVVIEKEMAIDEEGKINLQIDTAFAKAMHGDIDHRYEIQVEVTDQSRRTIVGNGSVLVAREPFKVYNWLDRGYYRSGDVIHAHFSAQTLDNKPVPGEGVLTLLKVEFGESGEPEEIPVETWKLTLDDHGKADVQCNAKEKGQYRFSFEVMDDSKHIQQGGVLFTIVGDENKFDTYRFNEIELIQDKREYRPGETVNLLVNTKLENATVALFLRPVSGIYLDPMIIEMQGKSQLVEIPVSMKDMPNFFIEALTVQSGRVYTSTREIIVPPEKRILNLEVTPQKETFKPGEEATLKVKVTDHKDDPFTGPLVVTVYDKALEYISGGSNIQDIRAYFWKWRRSHYPRTEHNLERHFSRILKKLQIDMQSLGVFGHTVADDDFDENDRGMSEKGNRLKKSVAAPLSATMDSVGAMSEMEDKEGITHGEVSKQDLNQELQAPKLEPTVRKAFADTAYWNARLITDANGIAEVSLAMPENLSTWKIKSWGMGHGTRVGEGETEIITTKNVLLRLQSPRFFVEKDEVVLSANIHNELDTDKEVTAKLILTGDTLSCLVPDEVTIQVPSHGESRVDWRVKALKEGKATIQMQALTDEESDAMEMSFPVYVHGIEKRISISGHIPSTTKHKTFRITIPEERRKEASRLEIRYSPTLAGAMVDALPYLVDYAYGCTEQTLNRFVPTVITQNILKSLDLDLKDIRDKRTNLNAQEIGEDRKRAKQWKRYNSNPVFDEALVQDMVEIGIIRLSNMQLSDGGWGWFSGWGERSYPHTTAVVVHGLQIAQNNGVDIPEAVLNRGINWLQSYQTKELTELLNWPRDKEPRKKHPDDMDALIYMILSDAGKTNSKMRDILYRDRTKLSVYGLTLLGMSLFAEEQHEQLNMVIRNIEQFLVVDDENQTAYLDLPNSGYWWYWYGSEYETHAYYLKLLSRAGRITDGKASGLVKYLLNNRKHATYWKSTRDTAVVIEAFADYLVASKEHQTDISLKILFDGAKRKEVHIDHKNLFTFDNTLLVTGEELKSGIHNIEIIKSGEGPLYYNAYLDYFSLEDPITAAGLEIKVNRKFYRLEELKAEEKVPGSHGQALDQQVEKWKRHEINPGDNLKSGDLVLVELTIESKNDYEYIIFEDWKAAGLEPVEVRSGYNGNEMSAYIEYRDEKVSLFVRQLARGKHSISYRLRAEIPGKFSALPTLGFAMYAPELKANGDEFKIQVTD